MSELSVINIPRKRQRHSVQFKQQIVAACVQPGASVAGIALDHGLNANMVRKWIRDSGVKSTALQAPAFLALPLPTVNTPARSTDDAEERRDTFCIEIPYRQQPIRIHWPVSQTDHCLTLLRDLLP